MKKRAILFALALLTAQAAFSCGKTETQTSISEEETTAAATEAVTEESTESTTKRKSSGSGLGFGMMGYVKKSRMSAANANAASLYKSVCTVLVDDQQKISCDMIYSNTDENNELNKRMSDYFTPLDPLDYIMGVYENGQPKWLLCSRNNSKDRYVGVYGDIENAEELRDMKWADVLAHFGFNEKEYTDIPLEQDESMNNAVQERPTLDLQDKNIADPCILAGSIAYELYNSSDSEITDCYGIWSKDKPFTEADEDDIPEHGDIEYIVITNSLGIGNVFCWDCDRDKSYVGDSEFGFGYENVIGMNWDEVLEKYNYKQGEYTSK